MTAKKLPPKEKRISPPVKTTKVPMTPEQRAARRIELREAREKKQAADLANREARAKAFEDARDIHWNQMWAKALRLELITAELPRVRAEHSWWFDKFSVNALGQSFRLEDTGSLCITRDSVHPSDIERINSALDQAFTWHTEYLAMKEQERLAVIRKAELRESAKAKLTDEEKEALGLSLH